MGQFAPDVLATESFGSRPEDIQVWAGSQLEWDLGPCKAEMDWWQGHPFDGDHCVEIHTRGKRVLYFRYERGENGVLFPPRLNTNVLGASSNSVVRKSMDRQHRLNS